MSKEDFRDGYINNLKKSSEEAKKVRKIVFIVIMSLLTLLVIGGIVAYFYVSSALKPVDPNSEEEITVEIPIGSSVSTIASVLEENGVIRNGQVFELYIKFKNESGFQAGEYTFTPAVTYDELISSLKNGKVMIEPVHTITIPEGLTMEQIGEIYGEELQFTKEEFMEVANNEEYIEELINSYPLILSAVILDPDIRTPLEGYLFGSTYEFFDEEPSIEIVIEKMLERTQAVYEGYRDEVDALGLTPHEAFTMASLVEKETGTVEERNGIAEVFYNRLEEGMSLQTDPTVQYAKGEHSDVVTYEDLEVESPYNTYHVTGLPVGPISNFGESSLQAIVQPEDHDYLYFLHGTDASIHYAETYDEHLNNRDEYMKSE